MIEFLIVVATIIGLFISILIIMLLLKLISMVGNLSRVLNAKARRYENENRKDVDTNNEIEEVLEKYSTTKLY